MGSIWIKEFTGGLDTRRMPETASGAVLIEATDGHIDRGGQFETRAAFVAAYALPPGTVGLAYDKRSLCVFGSAEAPSGIPKGVLYQRLAHPDNAGVALVRVPSFDMYAGKIFAVGEFADGGIYHFYDSMPVLDLKDGRARMSFTVDGGETVPAVRAVGGFTIADGASGVGNQITAVLVGGIDILGGAISFGASVGSTAAQVVAAINNTASDPNYSASAAGGAIAITAAEGGAAANGLAVVVSVSGFVEISGIAGMSGGADETASTLDEITVAGVPLTAGSVAWTGDASGTAAAIAEGINSFTSAPDYTATSVGSRVNILSAEQGTASNALVVVATTSSGLALTPTEAWVLGGGKDIQDAVAAAAGFTVTGGTDADGNEIASILIHGVDILGGDAVAFDTNATKTASAIATAVNNYTSTPNYTAVAEEAHITITAETVGAEFNGYEVAVTVGGNVTVDVSGLTLSGGLDSAYTYVPGTFVRTIGSRIHTTSGPNEIFSGINEPTHFTTDYTGAGFIDMSTQASGSEQLAAVATYQNWVAVFAEGTTQIWYFDSDPEANAIQQTLNNTGTLSPRSVTQFGDSDLFYLDESGLRSLRARDSSNAAATSDIGVPIDTLVLAKIKSLTTSERDTLVCGVIEPRDGRFWLIIKDTIYVFSYFPGGKISAWSTYQPGFDVEYATVFRRHVYVRSGDTVYAYGGMGSDLEYDETVGVARLPYLDGNDPARSKTFTGMDVACVGVWGTKISFAPVDDAIADDGPTFFQTTYGKQKMPIEGESTHVSVTFSSAGKGPSKLGAVVIHFEAAADED